MSIEDRMGFGLAPIKCEGQPVFEFLGDGDCKPLPYETTYVERSVPVAIENMVHGVISAMVNRWLQDNGFEEDKDE